MTVSSGAATVFTWLVNFTTVSGFVGWWSINLTYLAFCRFSFILLRWLKFTLLCRLRVHEAGIQQERARLLRSLSAISRVVGSFLDDVLRDHLRCSDVVQVGYLHILHLL